MRTWISLCLLKIKLEVDTDPPLDFNTEQKPIFTPVPFWVKSFTLENLFAGKISAILCRQWKTRVKGRDWFDYLWFIQNKIKLNIKHLEVRLREVEYYQSPKTLTLEQVKEMLKLKFKECDIKLVLADITKFISNPNHLDAWCNTLFVLSVDQLESLS